MTEPDDGARILAQYRDAIEPSSARLAAILRDVSDPDARPRILERGRRRTRARPASRRGLQLVVGSGLVALAAAVVAWWISSTTQRVTAVADDGSSQAPFGVAPREPAGKAARHGSTPVRPEPAPVEPTGSPELEAPSGVASPAAPAGSDASRSRPRATDQGALAGPSALARETALIEAAETSLRDEDPAGALAVLAEHAREFPRGGLAVEAAALRVIALCRRGNVAQGRGEATLLEQQAASKPYRERIRRACAEE